MYGAVGVIDEGRREAAGSDAGRRLVRLQGVGEGRAVAVASVAPFARIRPARSKAKTTSKCYHFPNARNQPFEIKRPEKRATCGALAGLDQDREVTGAVDGARTRDPRRDRPVL